MRTAETKVYQVGELSPEAFEKAYEDFQACQNECGIFWADEIIGSLKGIIEASGASLTDYSIGAYSPSYIKVDAGDCSDLQGKRAIAWMENNLLDPLRIPFKGKRRIEARRYTRPGQIPSCPFTGYCADDDLLDSLKADIISGETVGDSLRFLGNKCQILLESEYDYQMSEEYFREHSEANGYEYTASGKQF